MGGLAALFEAAAFVVGFWIFFTLLEPAEYGAADVAAGRHVAFLADNRTILTVWNLVIYVAFGAFLVVLALALHERLKGAAPGLATTGTAFGLIWAGLVIASGMVANIGLDAVVELAGQDPAEAAVVWRSYHFVVNGLGGGNEIVGGLWVLLISLAAVRPGGLPRPLNALGGVVGVAGLLTTVPALEPLGAVFGLGLIAWFACLGVVMLCGGERSASTIGSGFEPKPVAETAQMARGLPARG